MSDGDHELLMPFVNVRSVGGTYDDESYCAGYEMGRLDAELQNAPASVQSLIATINDGNRTQADLIAMRHGFDTECEPHENDWLTVTFRREP
jgi:hypothetical protein